jgi:uncharacterized ferritin-like protein (DUF455 family)
MPAQDDASLPATELRRAALAALLEADCRRKAAATRALAAASQAGLACVPGQMLAEPPGVPGRPALPKLVAPGKVPRRRLSTPNGRAALVHALAHIEFNAINLALDAVWRFACMPEAFYRDWIVVAGEEALHFSLLQEHLERLGHAYGDFDAHDNLWSMAEKTAGDVLARMALVPRTLEARGLDASPAIRAKFAHSGDLQAAAIVDVILADEVGHVAIGNRWYRWLCAGQGLDPHRAYDDLVRRYHAPVLRPPFNFEARRRAGFDEAELEHLARSAAAIDETKTPLPES